MSKHKKKAVIVPAANPPQSDFQEHPGDPEGVAKAEEKAAKAEKKQPLPDPPTASPEGERQTHTK